MSKQLPDISAAECDLGTILYKKWVVLETKNKVKKWHKLSGNIKSYKTYMNGSYPFKIIITDKIIIILKSTSNNQDKKNITDPWETCMIIKKYNKVFIGKHSKKYGNPHYPTFTGNSILIELKYLTYLFVGESLNKVITKEPIIKYISIMGNNYVPYPYALSKNYAYLLIEPYYLNRTDFGDIEPYQVYYAFDTKYSKIKHYKYTKKILS
jgi:hypothetical protein